VFSDGKILVEGGFGAYPAGSEAVWSASVALL